MTYIVTLGLDPDAEVWITKSTNISGLALEADGLDALIDKVKHIALILVCTDGEAGSKGDLVVSLEFFYYYFEKMRAFE